MSPFSKSPENFVWVYEYKTGGIKGEMPLFFDRFNTSVFERWYFYNLPFFDRFATAHSCQFGAFLSGGLQWLQKRTHKKCNNENDDCDDNCRQCKQAKQTPPVFWVSRYECINHCQNGNTQHHTYRDLSPDGNPVSGSFLLVQTKFSSGSVLVTSTSSAFLDSALRHIIVATNR